MNKLYVRVAPKSGNTQFYRCGLLFGLLWALVEVDNATAERLKAEQMLETSDTEPEGYVPAGEIELQDHTDAEDSAGDGESGDGEAGDGEAGDGEAGDGEAGDGETAPAETNVVALPAKGKGKGK